jgi:homoserine dehydrogenase
MQPSRSYRLFLSGLGNVNRSLLGILVQQADLLRERYNLEFRIVGVADSSGAAWDQGGIDAQALLDLKLARRGAAELPAAGRRGMTAPELARQIEADALLEATPVNLQDGQPGLETAQIALSRGISAVLANKGPLALAYMDLAALSDLGDGEERGDPLDWPALRFSACVGGFLPSVNVGRRDLAGCRVLRIEAVLNGTTQGILRMMESGVSYAEALAEMQRRGLAETDPTLDVAGWDAANKLTILANAVLRRPTRVRDLQVTGITALRAGELQAARARGEAIVLLCLAEWDARVADYRLSVAPAALPANHPLARMGGDEMGLVYETDIGGRLSFTSLETDPVPTAAAMLRDLIECAQRRRRQS